jgi:virginiamycin B lyase
VPLSPPETGPPKAIGTERTATLPIAATRLIATLSGDLQATPSTLLSVRQRGETVLTSWRLACATAVAVALSGFALAYGSQGETPSGTILWTQSPHGGEGEHGSIGRADFRGSRVDQRFIVGGKAPAGIAVSGDYIYWANYGSGTIARAGMGGSNVNERFVKAGDEYSVIGVAVDASHIYWTNSGIDPNIGWIGRANLDGSRVEQHFIKAGDSPTGLAIGGDHIYWTHRDLHQASTGWRFAYAIGRANLDGSDASRQFISVTNAIDGVAANTRYLFWSNEGEHVIGRAKLDGTEVHQRCIDAQTHPLETVPEGLAVDGEHVYWTNYPADTIARANLDGSDVDDHFIAVKAVPEGVTIRVTGGSSSGPNNERCGGAKPPLLLGPPDQSVGYYAAGWGEVAPAVISNGGAAASGTISQIHWSSWGGKVAVGHGLNPTYTPHGGYYRKPVVIELRASAIRRCERGGQLVYTRFTTREQVRPGGPMGKWFAWAPNMCVGFR